MIATLLQDESAGNPRAHAASDVRLAVGADGGLTALREGVPLAVSVRQAFPWTEPTRFLSLRDEDDKEVVLVDDVRRLDGVSRGALEAALAIAGFVLDVTRVVSIAEEVEVRHWQVETRQGPRSFQTRLDDWPRQLPSGALLVRDVAGDLYLVAEPGALDEHSRKLLWAFVD